MYRVSSGLCSGDASQGGARVLWRGAMAWRLNHPGYTSVLLCEILHPLLSDVDVDLVILGVRALR